ncbi:MAG TPA: ABC transporter ATP-binding protein [Nitrospirae bacterium]|nr:ABC transporter ATP-binding protein [Nitrospirota bacterium]
MIEIKDLYFEYPNGKQVFSGLDFSMKKGEKVGLIGPNGAGKTTLFHLIMGLLRPSKGEIRVFGKPRKDEKDFHEVRRRIGLLFQDSDDQLFCPTVEEDIAFGPLNLGMDNREVQERVHETCKLLGLNGLEKRVTYRLSGGEKRLVALATVFAMRPECYLLDEPTTGLDMETTERIKGFLLEHAETYIIISHDPEIIEELCNRVYRLDDGKVVNNRFCSG